MATKITVALNFPRTVGEALAYAKHIAASMTGNAYFPSPTLPLATLVGHIADLEAAHVVARTRADGAAAARNAKLVVVHDDLKRLRSYVETIANQHGEDAPAVVVSSGMSEKDSAGPLKAGFSAKQRKRSGSVRLAVRHPGIVTSFDWQLSTDGVVWTDLRSTVVANLDLDGLTPATRYHFRYRTLTRNGTSDWSDPLTLLVV